MTSHPKGANTPAPDTSPIDRAAEVLIAPRRGPQYRARLARAALSAALTNDADPDWLVKVAAEALDDIASTAQDYPADLALEMQAKAVADAVRAAILGEAR